MQTPDVLHLEPGLASVRVLRAFVKPAHGAAMREAESVTLRAGHGIVGDVSVACNSPRQVLFASEPVYRRLGLEPGALRENFLIDGEIESFASGQVLRLGPEVQVRLTIPCEPCAKLNRVRPGLARQVAGHRGFLGRVVAGGVVRPGDGVVLSEAVFPPMPLRPRERVYELVSRIPAGRVLGYKALVRTLGLTRTYVRVIPRFLAAAPSGVPVHRVVTTEGVLVERHVPEQARLLRAEGVPMTRAKRVRDSALWDPTEYFGPELLPAG